MRISDSQAQQRATSKVKKRAEFVSERARDVWNKLAIPKNQRNRPHRMKEYIVLERRLKKRQATAASPKEATMDGHLKETFYEKISEAATATRVETDVAEKTHETGPKAAAANEEKKAPAAKLRNESNRKTSDRGNGQ